MPLDLAVETELRSQVRLRRNTRLIAGYFGATARAFVRCCTRAQSSCSAGRSVPWVNKWKRKLGIFTYDVYCNEDVLQLVWTALCDDPFVGDVDGYREVRSVAFAGKLPS